MSSADKAPETLLRVLRDYLHVEWYELDELKADVKPDEWMRRNASFKAELQNSLHGPFPFVSAVNAETGHEFQSEAELVTWLKDLRQSLYGESQ
ncbi:hypothetical protein J7U46_22305 [Pelomonas sp. V22]|uniref:hypothetical protein n=1 Tax=Pelomonas sp. V22 TaxID=2822139 RepID=UPI0024A8067D|nr:hypothetical protein [Pelomonas sp. V22]MDI4635815.1 hypothetical protein [Pelomonas sp. V22]